MSDRSAWARLRRLLGRRDADDTSEEIEFHLAMRVRDYMATGMSEEEARMAAKQRLGDVEQVRRELGEISAAELRSERRRDLLADLGQDVRYGLRMLIRVPGLSATIVLTLALGIGATTAIFSVVWAVLLAPLPYPGPEQLVRVWETSPQGDTRNVVSAGNVTDWQERARSFTALGAHTFGSPVVLTREGDASRVVRVTLQPEVFTALGVQPILGRTLTAEDSESGGVALISHAFWQRHFGGDPGALGRTLVLDDIAFQVVGVMPPGFSFPNSGVDAAVDVWRPFTSANFDPNERTSHNNQVVARLAPGVSVESAQQEMARIAADIAAEHPREMTGWSARVVPLHDDITRNVRSLFWVLLGGVCVVLLITCGNVANLLLARALGRQRELAVRGALGAERGRIARQLLTESAVLAVLGGLAGAALAPMLLRVLVGSAPPDVPLLERATIDGRMLLFTAVTALSCALLFGLVPALRTSRADTEAALRGGRAAPRGTVRLRGMLLAGQIALSVILLVGAGLFVRSFGELQRTELGFDPNRLVLMEMVLPLPAYPEIPEQIAFFDQLQERAAALPGVIAASGSTQPPGTESQMTFSFGIEGRVAQNASGREDDETVHAVLPGYFETTGQTMVRGRAFTAADRADAPAVVILNETLARKHFPEGDAVGQRISFRPGELPWMEIVGVVGDARLESPDVEPREGIFIPFQQKTWPWLTNVTIVVRADASLSDPMSLAAGLRESVAGIDPNLPPLQIRTVEDAFRANTAWRSFATTLVSGFGVLAIALTLVGLYGLITYSVARERREIGVRIALGARSRGILARVLVRSLALSAVGALVGLTIAAAGSRAIAGLLYGVSPTDPATYALTVAFVLPVALLTAAAPALRAARTDPLQAIRTD
ncbi:MAG: ADOP family duplicated permease [Gemmatimonadales bacterium]